MCAITVSIDAASAARIDYPKWFGTNSEPGNRWYILNETIMTVF